MQDIAIPQLPSRSLNATLSFYERLGFLGALVGPDEAYAITKRGTLELHFFQHRALLPAESSFSCYLRVQDVDATYQSMSHAGLPRVGIPRMESVENKPWGMREFAIVDEDGTLIRIGQVIAE